MCMIFHLAVLKQKSIENKHPMAKNHLTQTTIKITTATKKTPNVYLIKVVNTCYLHIYKMLPKM